MVAAMPELTKNHKIVLIPILLSFLMSPSESAASIIQKKGYPNIDEGLHDLIDEFAKENQNNN